MDNGIIKDSAPTYTIIENYILESELVTEHEKIVFICLKRFYGKRFPSLSRLAKMSRLAKRSVQNALDGLTEKGYVVKSRRYGKDGSYLSNEYVLNSAEYMWTGSPATAEDQKAAQAAYLADQLRQLGYNVTIEKADTAEAAPADSNIIQIEKAPVLITDQSTSTDTKSQKTAAPIGEDTAIFSTADYSTDMPQNASVQSWNHENYIAGFIADHAQELTDQDAAAVAKELQKRFPEADNERLTAVASELINRMHRYKSGIERPVAYLITSIQKYREPQRKQPAADQAPRQRHQQPKIKQMTVSDADQFRKDSNPEAMKRFLDQLKHEGDDS